MAGSRNPKRPRAPSAPSEEDNIMYEKLSVALLNINGLREKTLEVRHIIARDELHVVALCETKLDDSVKDSEVYIPGFRMWRRDRDSNGGGVALYVQDHIETKPRSDLMETEVEIIWVEMKLPDSRPVLLGSCYRPPDNLKHLVQIYDTMDLVLKEKEEKDILLMGDFNTDWDLESRKNVAKYVSSKWGLTQIVQDKTRITEKSSTCIDLIYTNIKHLKLTSIATGCSDHNLVTAKLSRNVPKRFSRSNPDTQKFVKDKNNLKTGVKQKRSPLTALEHLTDNFLRLANQHSQLIQQNIYDTLRDKSKEDSISQRDQEKQRIQEEQKKNHKRASEPDQSKDRGVKCLSVTKATKTQIMKELSENKYDKILKICEEYFGESLPSHVININQQGDVASDLYYLREEEIFDGLPFQTSTDTFSFSELDNNELDNEGRKWLESLLRTDMKDADIPEIGAELLNSSADSISDPICHILNLCLEKCEFPSELNQFEFIPFSTKKLTKFRENRSLDSVHVMIGYIFDIILYKQAERRFIYKKLIPSKSVDDQIKNLKPDWLTATGSGKTVSCWFLDFSSSFDSISHDFLITKLKKSGFSDSALDLIKSFLSYHEGSCGLQRGSFLARLLFTVFINDLTRLVSPSSAVICQNHMIVYTKHKNPKTSEEQLEAKIQSVKEWAKSKVSHFKEKRHNLDKELDINVLFNILLELVNKLKLNWIQVLKEILMSQLAFKPKAVPEE